MNALRMIQNEYDDMRGFRAGTPLGDAIGEADAALQFARNRILREYGLQDALADANDAVFGNPGRAVNFRVNEDNMEALAQAGAQIMRFMYYYELNGYNGTLPVVAADTLEPEALTRFQAGDTPL